MQVQLSPRSLARSIDARNGDQPDQGCHESDGCTPREAPTQPRGEVVGFDADDGTDEQAHPDAHREVHKDEWRHGQLNHLAPSGSRLVHV